MTPFPLVDAIRDRIAEDIPAIRSGDDCPLLRSVTPITAELLRWWFSDDLGAARGGPAFHDGQRDAILAVVFAHEVLGATSVTDLYRRLAPRELDDAERAARIADPRNGHPKYAVKLATGTGKTWLLSALIVWQFLNAREDPVDERFTSSFLIVAPGLIVYDRLLDSLAGRRRDDGTRDPETGDLSLHRELFLPPARRDAVLGFVRGAVVEKQDIGRSEPPGGIIAVANWQRLVGARDEDPDFAVDDAQAEHEFGEADAATAARSFVPLTPGARAGNELAALDRRWSAGAPLDWLAALPRLFVINDEAHHVHSGRSTDPSTEVEWQRSLTRLAEGKGPRLIQVDLTATPYNERRGRRVYFDHIVTDFGLVQAMRLGLVKSLAFDRRQEIAALPSHDLDFRATRDENGRPALPEGQRTMLRAGLRRLAILEEQFAQADPSKHPRLLVVVEDIGVSPLVEDFLLECGVGGDDVLRVDSGSRSELPAARWAEVRTRLSDLDRRPQPRVIVSVLMLREGFDVDGICVIVPLRAAGSSILAEQTIGRGLRLMWRGDARIDELKRETRDRIAAKRAPTNLFDVLFVVEHPRFLGLYAELEDATTLVDDDVAPPVVGDAERIGLRDGYERYDFSIPVIRREAPEELQHPGVDVAGLPTSRLPVDELVAVLPGGDRFTAEDYETRTRFGAYTVTGAALTARGYNEWLAKLSSRVTGSVGRTFTAGGTLLRRTQGRDPGFVGAIPLTRSRVAATIDRYVRTRWAGRPFDPMRDEAWRLLTVDDVADEIAGVVATALVGTLENAVTGEPDVAHRRLSEVRSIVVRRSSGIDATKSIFARLPVAARAGGLERSFVTWADDDAGIEAIGRIDEYRHDALRRPYLKANGMPGLYSPDFLVRTAWEVYIVETKAQTALTDADVQRKANAARGWVEQLNALPPELRSSRMWHYVLLGEGALREWRDRGATASAALAFARIPLRADVNATLPGL